MRRRTLVLVVVTVLATAATRLATSGDDLPLADIMECRRLQVAARRRSHRARTSPPASPSGRRRGRHRHGGLPDGVNALVATRTGELRRVDLASGRTERVLDLGERVLVGSEGGLLAVAVDPDGRFAYLHYTDQDRAIRVVEYRLDGPAVLPASERELLSGAMHSGPDGALYLGFGNGGNRQSDVTRGADPGRLDGKLLRIVPRPGGGEPYGIPIRGR